MIIKVLEIAQIKEIITLNLKLWKYWKLTNNKNRILYLCPTSHPSTWMKAHLVHVFKHIFLVFKQYYTYFHTLFHSHVYPKDINNVTRITLISSFVWKLKYSTLNKKDISNTSITWFSLETYILSETYNFFLIGL